MLIMNFRDVVEKVRHIGSGGILQFFFLVRSNQ